ncbi:hypothetical protein D3C86_2203610 [compost metagenome]
MLHVRTREANGNAEDSVSIIAYALVIRSEGPTELEGLRLHGPRDNAAIELGFSYVP